MATNLSKLIKLRKDAAKVEELSPGIWYKGFKAVKAEAIVEGVPFLAVWLNAGCGQCEAFAKCLLGKTFTAWRKKSGIMLWFGCSTDKTTEEKLNGTGFRWARKNTLTLYPFVRLYSKADKVDVCESGKWWRSAKYGEAGAKAIIARIREALAE